MFLGVYVDEILLTKFGGRRIYSKRSRKEMKKKVMMKNEIKKIGNMKKTMKDEEEKNGAEEEDREAEVVGKR